MDTPGKKGIEAGQRSFGDELPSKTLKAGGNPLYSPQAHDGAERIELVSD